MSLPGNYAPRPSGYGNWVGAQAARAVAAYVLDNGHHLIAPYLGTTETARNIPPISYMDKIRMPGGPTHMRGYPSESKSYSGKRRSVFRGQKEIFDEKGLKGKTKVRVFRKPKFKRTKVKRTGNAHRTHRKRTSSKRTKC